MTTLNAQGSTTTSPSTQLADVFATVKPGQHVLVDVLGISTRAGRTADNLGLHALDRETLELLTVEPLTGETMVASDEVIPERGRFSVMNGHLSFSAQKDALGGESKTRAQVEFQVQGTRLSKTAPVTWFVGTATVTITA